MGKTLVVYYSAQSHTKSVATKIAANLGADTFEITPEKAYTETDLNWNDSNSRVSREHNDASLRNVALKSTDVPSWDTYDTVIIGYPIWWSIAAWPTNAFVKAVDFGTKNRHSILHFLLFRAWRKRNTSEKRREGRQLASRTSLLSKCQRF